ncbi:MAG: methanol--corrinoid methyltransferase [Candidatus Sumerlaeia bacterium]
MSILPAITRPQDLIFGTAPRPLDCGFGLTLGAGLVYPEINFTLPAMDITECSWPDVRRQYSDIIEGVLRRAVQLGVEGVIVEFELLPPMTLRPHWGAEITALLREACDRFHDRDGLRTALRVTPTDVRDNERPPRMRDGHLLDVTLKSFESCAAAGAHLLSIESTGGKELHDEALLNADVPAIIFALGVLAVRDMRFLWGEIAAIARRTGTIPAGDTACGFANTAMVLADRGMIPRVLAAVVRVAAAVRSLQAFEMGAAGPSKDCAYEGPYIKALTGVPISMEGRSSACAHLSAVGNIAAACADLWSNESVQNVRLLSASAPVVSMEQLIYDCRLMNRAAHEGRDSILALQRWLVESDAPLDPQAWVLRPDVVVRVAAKMASADTPLQMTVVAAREATDELLRAAENGALALNDTERRWLDMIEAQLADLPVNDEALWEQIQSTGADLPFRPDQYELK